jgi:predicted acyl esterase
MSEAASATRWWKARAQPRAAADPLAEEAMVPMRDGVRLSTGVYLPEPLRGRVPAILIRLPYDRLNRASFLGPIARYLGEHGYAVVTQDVRGKYGSEGEPTPFLTEAADGYDTLEWLAGQTWCSGAVGMYGDSYYGCTQWSAAASGHPALRAIVPRVTTSRIAEYFGAAVSRLSFLQWVPDVWSLAENVDLPSPTSPVMHMDDFVPVGLEHGRRMFLELLKSCRDGSITERIYPGGEPTARLSIPALHVGGWWDLDKPWQLRDWAVVSSRAPAAAQQHLMMGAIDHYDFEHRPWDMPVEDYLEDDEALERLLPRLLRAPIQLYDRHLLGRDVPELPRVSYQLANGLWHATDRWPPPGAEPRALHLARGGHACRDAQGGRLTTAAGEPTASCTWLHDPLHPVPSLVENDWQMMGTQVSEESVHAREDVATFTSEPLESLLSLAGPVTAQLDFESAAPAAHVIVTLCDVAPDGRALLLLEGVAVGPPRPGRAEIEVELSDTGYRVLPGHRLRIAVCSSRFPRYLPHPGTDEDAWAASTRRTTTQTLHGGRVIMTVVPNATRPDLQGERTNDR